MGNRVEKLTHHIRAWRKFRGLTIAELAAKAGCTPGLISQIERGESHWSQKSLENIAKALETQPGLLLDKPPDKQIEDGIAKLTAALRVRAYYRGVN